MATNTQKNGRKHDIEILRRIGIEYLNGRSLRYLSKLYSIPYRTIKYIKANKCFYLCNFTAVDRKGTTFYILEGDRAVPITEVAKKFQMWEAFRRFGM